MSRTLHHGDKAKDRNHLNRNWCGNEPKWWRKMMKHKKRRVAQRKALHAVKMGNEDATFPKDKQPWVYYW